MSRPHSCYIDENRIATTVECPVNVYKGETCGYEIDLEQVGKTFVFLLPECARCGTVWAEDAAAKETVESIAEEQIRQFLATYDGTPDDQDAWSGGFARNH